MIDLHTIIDNANNVIWFVNYLVSRLGGHADGCLVGGLDIASVA